MDKQIKNFSEIEAELFSLVSSIIKLYDKHQEGLINDNFLIKALKNASDGILKINIYLKEKNISLSEFVIKMNIIKEYNQAIRIINNMSALDHFIESQNVNESISSKKLKSYILELPKITSEITSLFITLMDALKLEFSDNKELIIEFFSKLKQKIKTFPGLDKILFKLKKIQTYVLNNIEYLQNNKKLREDIVDDLYKIYNEFQDTLHLNSS